MVDSNDSFLREIKQELEREKFERIWQRYGIFIIAGVVLVLAAVGGYQWWRAHTLSIAQEAGAQYEVALEQATSNKLDEAAKDFEKVVETAPKGYATLAELQLAATHLEAGKETEALATFEKVANDAGADTLLRDFARLQVAAIQLGKADWTEMENRLTDLTGAGNAWRHSARELLGLAALGAGKSKEAREYFESVLGDPEAPPSIQERARIRMESIVAEDMKASKQSDPVTEGQGKAAGDDKKAEEAKSVSDGQAKSQPKEAGK